MSRFALVFGLIGVWGGVAVALGQLRWFRRPALVDRLGPHVPGDAGRARHGALSVGSLAEVLRPLADAIGARLAALFGVAEELDRRLERIGADESASDVRLRQVGWAAVALGGALAVAVLARPPAPLVILATLGGPLLAFLLVENQIAQRSAAHQRRLFLELPVVTEQLATLLGAGWSLGGAIGRVADRGTGAAATDLARVRRRVRQGLSEIEALREWAEIADVDALDRLVPVLALNRETGDLGRLLTEEARSLRREVQRERIEAIERKTQQVWIPVTVATLVPGVMFLAVPFVQAMQLFSGG